MRRAKASKQELAHVHPTKIPIRQLAGGGEVSNGKHLRRITANAAATTKDLPDLAKNDAPKSRRRKKRDGATSSSSESVAEPCRLEFVVDSRGRSKWILHRKLKCSICCLRDVILKLERDLSKTA